MKNIKIIFCLLLVIIFWPKISLAYQISNVAGTVVSSDFVVGQGKNEVSLNPGEQITKEIYILNRSGRELEFTVSVEDFSATAQGLEPIKFSDTQNVVYPAKNWLLPEVNTFKLKHGEKMTLPVVIKVSEATTPGGLYGAVMVSSQPNSTVGSQVNATARIASLFFVKVNGDIKTAGSLEKFASSKGYYNQGPIDLYYSFKNDGNIYLNPYGEIKITNLWGKQVYQKTILPYFVMPGATRQQKESWQVGDNWGIYKAEISLSRGYDQFIDRQSVRLYVFPWSILISIIVVSILLLLAIGWAVIRFKK